MALNHFDFLKNKGYVKAVQRRASICLSKAGIFFSFRMKRGLHSIATSGFLLECTHEFSLSFFTYEPTQMHFYILDINLHSTLK